MQRAHNNFLDASVEIVGRDKAAGRSRQCLCRKRSAYSGLRGLTTFSRPVDMRDALLEQPATVDLHQLVPILGGHHNLGAAPREYLYVRHYVKLLEKNSLAFSITAFICSGLS